MGAYATTTSISELAPYLLKGNTTTSDTPGTAMFSRHIDRAEADVNAACALNYSLPFTSTAVPPLLRRLAEDLAVKYFMRGSYVQDGQLDQRLIERFATADGDLDDLRKGTLPLTYTDGSLVPRRASGQFLSSTENYTPVMGLDDPDKWERDGDEVTDQSEARD